MADSSEQNPIIRDYAGVTAPTKLWDPEAERGQPGGPTGRGPGLDQPVPGGAPIRDWDGVTRSAEQWTPAAPAAPGAPGAMTTVTEWTTPKAGINQFLVNGRIRLNDWAPAGTRLGIGVSYPLEPEPPPLIEIADLWFNPSQVVAGENVSLVVRLSGEPGPTDLSIDLAGPAGFTFPAILWVRAGTRESSVGIGTPSGWSGPANFTATLASKQKTVSLTVTPPFPPPGPVEVESCTLTPTSVLPGETAMLMVRLKAPAPERVDFFLLTDPEKIEQPPVVLTFLPAALAVSVPLKVRLGASGSVPIIVSREGRSDTATLQIRTPPPPPIDSHNVRHYGAKGNGVTDDRAAFQAAAMAATAQDGQVLFIPKGTYLLNDSTKIFATGGRTIRSLRIEGEGPESLILHDRRIGLAIGTGGQPYEGIEIRGLSFKGIPGAYMKSHGNTGQAIQVYGPKGTVVEDCEFWGSGTAVFNAGAIGQTYGTVMRRLKVNGWGAVCLFLNGGDLVQDCQLLQDDPLERQENSSHGIYIHSGCNDVTVEDVLIFQSRKYAIQCYGQDENTEIRNVILRDVTMRSCANGLTLQHSGPGRAVVKNLVVERLVTEDIYGGPALSIKQGDGAVFRDCRLSCRAGVQDLTALQLGVWAPYEPGFSATDMTFEGLQLSNAHRGIWALQSFGGRFSNIAIKGPRFVNCRNEIAFETWNGPLGDVPVEGIEITV